MPRRARFYLSPQNTHAMTPNRLITLAIHTFERAQKVKLILEREGIPVELNNVNLANPEVSAGVRVRIKEADLPKALRIVENFEIFNVADTDRAKHRQGKILVPTDFSPHTSLAVKLAMQLASRMNCEVEFMHAFISPSGSETIQLSDAYDYELEDMELTSQMQQQAETLMKRFAHTVRDDIKSGLLPAVKFSTIVSEGIPEEVILSYTREEKPLMVVMSTREAGKKETELIGSVTAEVLDRCRVPAFTVPENTDFDLFGKHERVAFFCNLDQEDMLALDSLYRLFPDIHLDVTLISVPPRRMRQTPPTQAADNLLKYCREHYAGYTFSVEYIKTHSVFDDLDNIATRKPFDMICLPNKHKNVFARVFNPSLAHKILFRADIPMVVIPV